MDTVTRVREIYPEMELLYTDGIDGLSGEPSDGKVETYIFKDKGVMYIAPKLWHRPDGKWRVRPESVDNKKGNWRSFLVETLDEALDILRKGKEETK